MSRVCVHGLGQVGLPTAALLAQAGHRVLGFDIDPARVAAVGAGEALFPEPGLAPLVAAMVRQGTLRAAARPGVAEFHLVAVPTPLGPDRRADLSAVEAACDGLAPLLRPGDTVILESTVPVCTTEALATRLAAARPDLLVPLRGAAPEPGGIHLAHCPERVLPGRALVEMAANDRLVGGLGAGCAARAAELYAGWVRGALVLTDCRLAEFAKLAENAFRDVNIAFANELALLGARHGLDARQAIALANRHPRVQVLDPGAGVGGHCIPVDPWFLAEGAPEEARLIRAARAVNDAVPRRLAARIRAEAARFAAPRIACLGLAYKPDVGDLRESPALAIALDLAAAGFSVVACDPFVRAAPPLQVTADPAAAIAGADIVAILVAHSAFRSLDPPVFAGKVVVDPVGLLAG